MGSITLTGKETAVKALELVGVASPYEPETPREYMEPALRWLDTMLDTLREELPASFFRQVPEVLMPVLAGIHDYNLYSSMEPSNSPRLALIEAVFLRTYTDPTDRTRYSQREIDLVPLDWIEDDATTAPMSGTPGQIWVSRSDTAPKVRINRVPKAPDALPPPAPAPDLTTNFAIMLRGYTIGPAVASSKGAVDLGMPKGWGLYLSHRLAALIGSGPVVRLPIAERNDLRAEASRLLAPLLGRSARDNESDALNFVAYEG